MRVSVGKSTHVLDPHVLPEQDWTKVELVLRYPKLLKGCAAWILHCQRSVDARNSGEFEVNGWNTTPPPAVRARTTMSVGFITESAKYFRAARAWLNLALGRPRSSIMKMMVFGSSAVTFSIG